MNNQKNMPDALCELPPGYEEALKIDLTDDTALLKKVSVRSLQSFLLCLLLLLPPIFFRLFPMGDILSYMRPGAFSYFSSQGFWGLLITMILAQFAVIFIHEGIHGLFFKLYAQDQKVVYGFAKGMAYAGCPGVYFSRRAYIQIGLAPLFFFSLPCYIMLFTVSLSHPWGYAAIAGLFLLNTSGAVGDLYTWSKARKFPKDSYWLDTDTGCIAYTQSER